MQKTFVQQRVFHIGKFREERSVREREHQLSMRALKIGTFFLFCIVYYLKYYG